MYDVRISLLFVIGNSWSRTTVWEKWWKTRGGSCIPFGSPNGKDNSNDRSMYTRFERWDFEHNRKYRSNKHV